MEEIPHLTLRTLQKLNPKGLTNPQLVTQRRDTFRRLAKAKLLNTPGAPAVEAYLRTLDEELARRNIVIHDPELQ